MSRTTGADDQDWLFLDNVIALALDIINAAQRVKQDSDDPQVLYEALKMESAALIIQRRAIDYRSRLRELKKIARRVRAGRPEERSRNGEAAST